MPLVLTHFSAESYEGLDNDLHDKVLFFFFLSFSALAFTFLNFVLSGKQHLMSFIVTRA